MTSPGLYATNPEGDTTAEVEKRVLEINKAFAGWILASWDMCPTHTWTGAAQEYCNKIEKLLKEYSLDERGGSDLHLQSPTTAWNATGTAPQQPNTSPPPFGATTAVKSIHSSSPNSTAPSPPFSFVSGTFQPQTTPAAVGLVPSSGIISPTIPGPIPCESPNQGAPSSTSKQQRHQQQPQQQQQFPITTPPVASAAPVATASKSATRKRRATEDPEGAPNSHNPPKHPLLSSMLSTQSYQPASSVPAAASAEIPSFSFAKSAAPAPGTSAAEAPTRAAKRSSGQPTGGGSGSGAGGSGAAVAIPKPPLFGSLFSGSGGAASNAAVSGGAAAASSAATAGDPAASKPFAALFGNSVAGAGSSSQPLFGAPDPTNASSPSAGSGGGGFGGLFGSTNGKTDGNVAASFTFGSGGGTPMFGAGGGFGGGAGVTGSISTPTFGTLGAAGTGVATTTTAAAPAAAPADDEAEMEPTQKVELKGDDKTEIQFSSKTSFRFMLEGKWGEGTVGALTVRKDKTSGTSWLQVNNESKGNILLYAAFIKNATATVTEAKGIIVVSLNVFKFPPGKEPSKTVDDGADGKKTLSEVGDNPISAKNAMFKVKADNLSALVDTLTSVGIKCNKK